MAKKSRVASPPRPVKAPKRRVEPKVSNRRRLTVIGLAVLAVSGAALIALATRLGGEASAATAMREAGCTFRTHPATTARHVPESAKVTYNSFPPSNGAMTDAMIVWGFYREPVVGQKQLVHNLEHGGIVIQYGARVDTETIDLLEAFYRDDPNGVVVAELPALGDKIALVAWNAPAPTGAGGKRDLGHGIVALCPRFDRKAFDTFRSAHRYRGPEPHSRETLEPGR
jgi:hypothetical protein